MKNLIHNSYSLYIFIFTLLISCEQSKNPVTLDDYQRAEKFLSVNTNTLVYNDISGLFWQSDGRLIYRKSVDGGYEYVLADPMSKEKRRLFESKNLTERFSDISDKLKSQRDLVLSNMVLSEDNEILDYDFSGKRYLTNLSNYNTSVAEKQDVENEFLSPDGKLGAFISNYNLWVRNTETGQKTQLTFDGVEDYGYATNNAGWIKRASPVLKWSPNSDKIATFRHDGRGVGEMYLYNTKVGHPKLDAWKYPLPGDSLIFRIERIVIHLGKKPKVVKLKMDPDPHRSTISDHVAGRGGEFLDVSWNKDGSMLSFVSSSRDHKVAHLQIANTTTGDVRSVIKEEVETYFESGFNNVNWSVLTDSDEVIWFSERSNWGHLYLLDLKTGVIKNQITKGEWAVLQVHYIDEVNRRIYFLGSNKEEGDPYFQYLYRINYDGTDLRLLTPENANHSINWSEQYNYFTDMYSTPTDPPISVIRNTEGEVVLELETVDISQLKQSGWVPPVPFIVKARDKATDLYGLMYKPSNFDASTKYPVLNYLYPGPQTGSVGSRSFRASRNDKQSLAELGFIVVEVDAMGTPGRSKSIHDGYYGNMGDNGLPDQISMIQQLAAKYSWMDIDKVGIWGHSGGGFASTAGILRYPDFYKVAVSGAGNHDNRNYEDDWGEKWQGLLINNPDAVLGDNESINVEIKEEKVKTNYDNQANQLLAENLKGKLLIAHGMMDDNVHPTNTLLVVDALIKADKDFDMLVFPNARHGFGNSRYFMKRRWDYFVRHLKGAEPPGDFAFNENVR